MGLAQPAAAGSAWGGRPDRDTPDRTSRHDDDGSGRARGVGHRANLPGESCGASGLDLPHRRPISGEQRCISALGLLSRRRSNLRRNRCLCRIGPRLRDRARQAGRKDGSAAGAVPGTRPVLLRIRRLATHRCASGDLRPVSGAAGDPASLPLRGQALRLLPPASLAGWCSAPPGACRTDEDAGITGCPRLGRRRPRALERTFVEADRERWAPCGP